jgi:hypothetical protein
VKTLPSTCAQINGSVSLENVKGCKKFNSLSITIPTLWKNKESILSALENSLYKEENEEM